MNIAWSGLADAKYYEHIAKYCLPSWTKLPGDKYVVCDNNVIDIPSIEIVKWNDIYNQKNKFTEFCNRTKPVNFWRKMQSQVWALTALKNYDWVVLLDTDVEILDFDILEFDNILKGILADNYIWATGESQLKKLDAGHIVVNMKHPKLTQLIYEYEDIWESKKIFSLFRAYDGEALESMFVKYPSFKIKNTDHGGGLHTYKMGTVHYGSKIPKELRSIWKGTSQDLISEMIKDKEGLLKSLKE
jgi:hypothetical protein